MNRGYLCFLLISCTTINFGAIPLIHRIEVKKNLLKIYPTMGFLRKYLGGYFWVKYNDRIDLEKVHYSVLTIPFITSIIHVVWASGQEFSVKSMDYDLYYSLEKINLVFRMFYPQTDWSGKIIPEKLIKNKRKSVDTTHDIAVLFSGGLDAIATSFGQLGKKQFLITIQGRDIQLKEYDMWQNIKEQNREFAHAYGNSAHFIVSNFHANIRHHYLKKEYPTMPYWGDTSQSLALSGLTAPLLIDKSIDTILMASSRTADYPFALGSHPMIDNNIQFCGIRVYHDQPKLSRIKKMEFVATTARTRNVVKPYLRVCWGKSKLGGNCYRCEKCLRTMNIILALGEQLQDYGFDRTPEQVMQATRILFRADKKGFMKFAVGWNWECVQERIKQVLEGNDPSITYPEEQKEYLQWLSELCIDTYCYDNRTDYEQHKRYFQPLWDLAEDGPVDLETIITLAKRNREDFI